ncbi:unnamed protein product [Dibothriocephalus latus]|uniref:Glycoside hydrolase family 38 N-terminal domain-containing protein n=1 Tax=Dibothriocephalus latus TaxID=60516 RepID=A0A3P6U1J3_DIBLA|nr:unnamed protein product [Dibothriocephalus latus]
MTFRKYLNTKAKPILDSTLNFLHKNKEARFIYAEVSFLDGWWSEMTAWQKTTFKRLLQEGQWEIATGGWVMNDEASTHYAATAAQLAEGQHWLMDNLGYFPNVSWAIDPFGHGTTDAYLKRKAGLEHILIHRTHYEIKGHFGKQRTLEFRWRQPWDSSGSTDVFCHMLPYAGYGVQETCGPSPGVCWQFDFSRQSRFQFPWSPPRDEIDSDNVETRFVYNKFLQHIYPKVL